jgi:hypothetical protein
VLKSLKSNSPSRFKNSDKNRVIHVRRKSISLISKNMPKYKDDSSGDRIRTPYSPGDTLKQDLDSPTKTRFRKKSQITRKSPGISAPSRNTEASSMKEMMKFQRLDK